MPTIPKLPPVKLDPIVRTAREFLEKVRGGRPPKSPDKMPGGKGEGGRDVQGNPPAAGQGRREKQDQKKRTDKKHSFGPGVVKFEDAMKVVEDVLIGASSSPAVGAWKKLKGILGASDLDDEMKFDAILSLMEAKILSQKAPRARQALKVATRYPSGAPERDIMRRNNRGFIDKVMDAIAPIDESAIPGPGKRNHKIC